MPTGACAETLRVTIKFPYRNCLALEWRIILMQIYSMSIASPAARPGVTVRLEPEAHARLQQIAKAEHRSVAAVLELLVEREIRARDEAERMIRLHVAPELQAVPFGDPDRRPGESDKSYARRKKTIDALFGR
jgi:hypothetical protein